MERTSEEVKTLTDQRLLQDFAVLSRQMPGVLKFGNRE